MPAPLRPPIGLQLARVARGVSRAFDTALTEAGGSLPGWLIMISLKTHRLGNQRELAAAVGINSATLTHHLNALERDGMVVRRRDPENRRIQHVELTAAGEAAFLRMRDAALAFDARLRHGLGEPELAAFAATLERLRANAGDFSADGP